MRLKRAKFVSGAVIGVLLMAVGGLTQSGARAGTTSGAAEASTIERGSVVLSGSPGVPAVNPMTGTLYVPIQCPVGCPSSPLSHEMDVIDAATCNALVTSDCRVVARARVGNSPLAAAVDDRTDTIYVANATGSVSVVNGVLCNATVTSGCGTPLATIHVGGFPVDAVFNPRTRTLYVASPAGDVFVIDSANCNAVTIRGCGQHVKKVRDSLGPQAVDVDVATDTVYAANIDSGSGSTVSVIDGATCNGGTGTGCGLATRTITVGGGASWDAVDQNTDTVYVANSNDSTVSVINGARCNATITSGCGSTPPTVSIGAGAVYVAVDDSLHTVFAINQGDDTLSAIDTRTCKGTATSGCSKTPPSVAAGSNHNPGYTAFPNTMTLLPQTDTAYVVNVGGENRVSVITLSRCNALDTSGCRKVAPSVPQSEFLASVDPVTDTIYASNLNLPEIDVIDGATCDAKHLAGCTPVAEIPMRHPQANVGSIDDATDTLYASDPFSDTVSVINTSSCNAQDTTGCADHPPTITVGRGPGAPVLNPATRTLYVPFGVRANRVAVVDAAICNAEVTTGCGQTPGVAKVGENTFDIAVSAKTDTIYAPSAGNPFASGNKVWVINGATCNRSDHSGCGHPAATVKVGRGPIGVAVDDATDTVYVANNTNGDTPGTVSIINGATCNGSHIAGCTGDTPTVVVGRSPLLVAVDTRTDVIYVSDFSSAGVFVLDGSTCNAMVVSGCHIPAPEQAVGSQPFGLAVNEETNTIYAMNILAPGSMSIFRGTS